MSLYAYRCPRNHEFDEIRPQNERNDPAKCPICGESAKRILSPSTISMVKYPRWMPTVGEMCDSDTDYQRKADRTKHKMEKEAFS